MAVTKRTRFEVLRRDNHTCRYCGATAPEAKITIDHVTPVALGGTDDPSNLVAACRDCNYGKSSTSPDTTIVEDVAQIDLQWAGAMKRAAAQRKRDLKKLERYIDEFDKHWDSWTYGSMEYTHNRDKNWRSTIARFYSLGVPIEEIKHCTDVALSNRSLAYGQKFRYFAGCVWRVVTDMQDAAKQMLEEERAPGGDGA